MPRFSKYPYLVTAITEAVRAVQHDRPSDGVYDGHDIINYLNDHFNHELNQIIALYQNYKDPERTADQQIGRYLYKLGQVKIGERVSYRRITRRDGSNRNGPGSVSVWAIRPGTRLR